MTYAEALRNHVQRSFMRDGELTLDEAAFDEDGDMGVMVEDDLPVYVRVVEDGHTTWARVWAPVASGLKSTAKLLREVNDHNVASVAVRLLLSPGGQLIAAAEVPAESIEPGELGRLVHLVSAAAEQVGELVQLVYGQGSEPDPARSPGS